MYYGNIFLILAPEELCYPLKNIGRQHRPLVHQHGLCPGLCRVGQGGLGPHSDTSCHQGSQGKIISGCLEPIIVYVFRSVLYESLAKYNGFVS